jgi:hypothetical protein
MLTHGPFSGLDRFALASVYGMISHSSQPP